MVEFNIVSRDADGSNEHTMLIKIESTQVEGPKAACLVVVHGERLGRLIELTGIPLVIGRSPRSDLQIDDDSVSRQHARIEPDPHAGDSVTWQIVDLDSTNGTYVNDKRVRFATLKHRDEIHVGRTILKFLEGNSIERAYHEELYKLQSTDGLTQLRNRRGFDEALADEVSRSRRFGRPLSLCMLDADKFKSINDQYGHLAGDAVLRQLGAILRSNVRASDIAARLGGEEFAVLLPETGLEHALRVAEKLRGIVAQHRFEFEREFDRTVIPVTLSIGVAELRESDTEPAAFVRRADECLYRAKREGRNRVVG